MKNHLKVMSMIAVITIASFVAIGVDAYSYSGSSGSYSVPYRSYSSSPYSSYSVPSRSYTPSVQTYSVPTRTYTAPQVSTHNQKLFVGEAPTQTFVHEYGFNPFSTNFFLWYWIFHSNKSITSNLATTTATTTYGN